MESFSAEWLALREPADHAARDETLTRALAAALAAARPAGSTTGPQDPRAATVSNAARADSHLRAVDLGAGAGSNVRYLLPRLPQVTHWTLVDHDAALLEVARRSLAPAAASAGVTIETHVADLRDLAALPLDGCQLVTGAALLDLVSAAWIEGLAARCAAAGSHVLFALSYDGRLECTPADPWDARVRELVNMHQRTDKGFGPALGPDATRVAREAFGATRGGGAARTDTGAVRTAQSNWVLGAADAELQRQLVAGWAQAAQEIAPGDAEAIAAWRMRRLDAIARGASTIRVGHQDLLMIQAHRWAPAVAVHPS